MQNQKTHSSEDVEVLKGFLSCDMQSADDIFRIFGQIESTQTYQSGKPGERFLFKKGDREDRMTFIAHADTFYDRLGIAFERTPIGFNADASYMFPAEHPKQISQKIVQSGNILHGENKDFGIGADDRAGCAILWLMRNSGHNILLFDGEESFYRGAKYLINEHKDIYEEVTNSRFAVEFDFPWADELSYHGTPVTDEFRQYIEGKTGYVDNPHTPPTDIGILCRSMPAVNLSVGYYNPHTQNEYLDINVWQKTLGLVRELAQEKIPKFNIEPKKQKFFQFPSLAQITEKVQGAASAALNKIKDMAN